jgi:hypothetical protein
VAALAARSALFLSHFEHRVWLGAPTSWLAVGAQPAIAPSWRAGVLTEPKYLVFRHDAMVGSFHPLHRAKWTAHELCHRLVGYGYRAGATPLWNTLAAWAAELLPVALWYFFDEAGLARCERHANGGPLFGAHCHACEQLALKGRRKPTDHDETWLAEGRRYVREELQAIEGSMRYGKPIGTRHASIHLASDALGYVAAHGARLGAPEMERFVGSFVGPEQGRHATLDALLERIRSVCEAIVDGSPLTPWRASRWDWIAQDLGYRLLTAHAQLADRGRKRALDEVIDGLAKARSEQGIAACIRSYTELARKDKARQFRSADDVFAVGYALSEGVGRSRAQVLSGIASALPSTCDALQRRLPRLVDAFLVQDAALRLPIGLRFADFLQAELPGPVADFARVEASIVHARPMDAFATLHGSGPGNASKVSLSPSAEIVRMDHDVLEAAPRTLARCRRRSTPRFIAVSRSAGEEVDLVDLPENVAIQLATRRSHTSQKLGLEQTALKELIDMGIVVCDRYELGA